MVGQTRAEGKFDNDAFISYSRRDIEFARVLEMALERYHPPKGLGDVQRRLRVFRDESDFTGTEYHRALEEHLKSSRSLIVICSPDSRASSYVNDEIRRFAGMREVDCIVPVMIRGVPNNEAKGEQESAKAFPEALCELAAMPLAASFLGWQKGQSIQKGPHLNAWHTVLANLLQTTREEVEQRERHRHRQRAAMWAGMAVTLTGLGTFAVVQVDKANKEAAAHQLYAKAQSLPDERLDASTQMLMESLRLSASREVLDRLRKNLLLMPVISNVFQLGHAAIDLRFTSDDSKLVAMDKRGAITVWSTVDMTRLKQLEPIDGVGSVSLAPDGGSVAWWGRKGATVRRTADGEIVWQSAQPVRAVAFSPNGRFLAVLGGNEPISTIDILSGKESKWPVTSDVSATAINHDGQQLATAIRNRTDIWRAGFPQPVSWVSSEGHVVGLTYEPNGDRLANTLEKGTLAIIWLNPNDDGKMVSVVRTLYQKAGESFVDEVAFGADGSFVAALSRQPGTVNVWHGLSAYEIHAGEFRDVPAAAGARFGAGDANTGVLGIFGGSVARVWQADAREELKRIIHPEKVSAIVMSSNSRWIATATVAGKVIIWRGWGEKSSAPGANEIAAAGDYQKLVEATCARLLSLLKPDEWRNLAGLKSDVRPICPQRY